MNNDCLPNAEKYISAQRGKSRRHKLLTFLAAVVVFCTTYALILPAITLEKGCQLQEHIHTDACYTQLLPEPDSSADLIYADEPPDTQPLLPELTCALPEDEGHTHTQRCYGQWELTCPLPEHTHTAQCRPPEDEPPAEDVLPAGDESPAQEELPGDEVLPAEDAISPEDQARLDAVSALIAALPDSADLAEALETLEAAGDPAALEEYYHSALLQARSAYAQYQELSPDLQAQLANRDKLLELEWLWDAETLTENFKFDQPTVAESASTKDFIDLNLYDYGSNINDKWNSDNKYPGFQQDEGTSAANLGQYGLNYGNNITEDLAAGNKSVTNQGGTINSTTNGANSPISGAMQTTLGKDGYPALSDGTSLSYLFSNSDYAKKQNSQSINGLFQHDTTTGAYTFNSRTNHAQFNPADDTFTLYQQIISSNFIMYPFGNFLPFNDIVHQSAQASTIDKAYLQTIAASAQYKYNNGAGEEYKTLSEQLTQFISLMDGAYPSSKYPDGWTAADCANEYFKAAKIPKSFTNTDLTNIYSIDFDEPTDFYFGMEMKMNFFQPKGGLTGTDGKQPMIFYFTGDDDVWIYVDGVLFLDLSGIHRHVGGEIDFVNGVVKYYALDVSTGDVSDSPYKTVKFSELVGQDQLNEKGTFQDYSNHSFNFYYMERGAGSGVCRMNFNFPLLKKNSISVTKELSVDDPSQLPLLGDPDFKFQVLKENGSDLFIPAGTDYDILDASGSKIDTGKVGENGVFTLKAGQTAVFSGIEENEGKYFVRELLDENVFDQYGQVSVNGSTITKNYGIEIGESKFTGLDSPVQDMSNGSTVFRFNNHVTTSKLGSLSIAKTLTGYSPARASPQFTFVVTLDGKPLPVGTKYTVGTETRKVETEGIITLAPDETAVISNILAGTKFTVEETEASAKGYTVTYTVNGNSSGSPASGTVGLGAKVEVIVNNTETGTSVNIPVQKTLEFPDGQAHTYTFQLTQVTDISGAAAVENGLSQSLPITVTVDPVTDKFTIGYPFNALGAESPKTFYYKITEQNDGGMTIYDGSVYVVAVTLTRSDDGTLSAQITEVRKDGETQNSANPITFVNQLVRYELPATGGPGTRMYTAPGLLLTFAAAALLLCQYKQRGKGADSAP